MKFHALKCFDFQTINHTIETINIGIPADFGAVIDVFEILNGELLELQNTSVQSDLVTVSAFLIPSNVSKRIFLLANTLAVRQEVLRNLGASS